MKAEYKHYLRIVQKPSQTIAEEKYEIGSDGKLTVCINQSGVLCHHVEFTAQILDNSKLELGIPDRTGVPNNMELLSPDEPKEINVCIDSFGGLRPFTFTYTKQGDRYHLQISPKVRMSNIIRHKGKLTIHINDEGKLVSESSNSNCHQIEVTTKIIEEVVLKLNDDFELGLNSPQPFKVYDNILQRYISLTFEYTQEGNEHRLQISQKVPAIDLDVTKEKTKIGIYINKKGGLQNVHFIEFDATTQNENGNLILGLKLQNQNDEHKFLLDEPKDFDILDNLLERELPLIFTYTKDVRHYIKVSQKSSKQLSEVDREITGEQVDVYINNCGELVPKNGHILKFNAKKENDKLVLHCGEKHVADLEVGSPRTCSIWDEQLQRDLLLTYIYTNVEIKKAN